MESSLLALALHLKKGVGYAFYRKVLREWGSLVACYEEGRLGLTEAELDRGRRELEKAEKLKVKVITVEDPNYPQELLSVAQPPLAIYVKGKLLPAPRVAVVGSRRCSSYGRRVAYSLGKCLSSAGVTVVSGLAQGIDAEGHRGALEGEGKTLAVLGSGVDSVFPLSNLDLARRIVEEGGGLISEFPLGTKARKEHFPRRNRIVSGLSKAVVVVEAPERSGSFITVNYALDQGKEVFAVPGPVDSPFSKGSNRLILEGATPLLECEQLLELFGAELQPLAVPEEFKELYALLSEGPKSPDRLAQELGVPVTEVLCKLSLMEVKGLVRREGGVFSLC